MMRKDLGGIAASMLLHLMVLLLWLAWHTSHPAAPAQVLKSMMVDLVVQPLSLPGPAGGAAVKAPVPQAVRAPRPQGVAPKAVTPPPDALEARIQGLANLSAAQSPLPAADNDGTGAGGSGTGGGYTLADYVRSQILRKWWPDLVSGANRGVAVTIRLTMARDGAISNVRIVDQQRYDNDAIFRGMAQSARNATMLASPIPLPPGNYPASSEITITLDPKAVLK